MAERLDGADLPVRRGGAPQKYPWDEWFDGSVWRLILGEDFEEYQLMRVSAYQAARRRGMKCSLRKEQDGNVLLQARRVN